MGLRREIVMLKVLKSLIIIILFTTVTLTACGNSHTETIKKSKIDSHTALPESVISKIISVKGKEGKSTDINVLQKKIIIYTIDDANKTVSAVNTFVDAEGKLELKNVLDSVFLELSDYVGETKVSDIASAGTSVTIDLKAKEKSHPFGKSNEVLILDCISYSIFENFPEYKEVYFKVNGEAYNSQKIKISGNKPFMNR